MLRRRETVEYNAYLLQKREQRNAQVQRSVPHIPSTRRRATEADAAAAGITDGLSALSALYSSRPLTKLEKKYEIKNHDSPRYGTSTYAEWRATLFRAGTIGTVLAFSILRGIDALVPTYEERTNHADTAITGPLEPGEDAIELTRKNPITIEYTSDRSPVVASVSDDSTDGVLIAARNMETGTKGVADVPLGPDQSATVPVGEDSRCAVQVARRPKPIAKDDAPFVVYVKGAC